MRAAIVFIAAIAVAGCSTQPTVRKTVTTLGEVDMTGMECRREGVTGSMRSETVCASPETWAVYDAKQRAETDALLAQQRVGYNAFDFHPERPGS